MGIRRRRRCTRFLRRDVSRDSREVQGRLTSATAQVQDLLWRVANWGQEPPLLEESVVFGVRHVQAVQLGVIHGEAIF